MHPAPSIILFTTLSGLGFGMLAFLGFDISPPLGWIAFVFFVFAYVLSVGGLLASTFHLGHPERALKAFSQWRSSWLSREGCAAVATLVIMALYGLGLVFFDARWSFLGILGAALAVFTIFATSMIYTQMRTVPRWNHWSPPVLFLGYAIAGGALMTGRTGVALWLLLLVGIVQIVAWLDQDRREKASDTNLSTATGLGHIGTPRAFEAPHTGENYLTQEMVFRVGRKHAAVLKIVTLILAVALPVVLLMLPFHHLLAALAVISHISGVLVQRWLFFAEARHVVGHYYGR